MATQIVGRLFPKTLTSLTSFRSLSTRATILSVVDRINHSPNSSALKLRNGYDYYRTTVFMQNWYDSRCQPPTMIEIIQDYVKTLAGLVGSEEEAMMMVYSYHKVSDNHNLFGTLLSDELYHRVEVLPGVSLINRRDFVDSKNIDEICSTPFDVLEKSVRAYLVEKECWTKQGIGAATPVDVLEKSVRADLVEKEFWTKQGIGAATPVDVLEKSVRAELVKEEEFWRLLLTKHGIGAA